MVVENKLSGPDYLKEFLQNCTEAPGIYQMFNSSGQIIYIGKALNLKNRLGNYLNISPKESRKVFAMVSNIARIEIIRTKSEIEALLLEASLVKKNQPIFNVLLKDDKTFPYLMVDTSHEYPSVQKHRGKKEAGKVYFGPFASGDDLYKNIKTIKQFFQLRGCSDSEFASRKRPCIEYEIKRCTAPCVQYIRKEAYNEQVKNVIDFLAGKSNDVQKRMIEQMNDLAQNQEYEKAAALRDRIQAITMMQSRERSIFNETEEVDIFVIDCKASIFGIWVLFVRQGRNLGGKAFFISNGVVEINGQDFNIGEANDEEEKIKTAVLTEFILQFYQDNSVPKEVILNHKLEKEELLIDALSTVRGKKIIITSNPKIGKKREIVEHVEDNLIHSFESHLQQKTTVLQNLVNMKEIFGLKKMPQRIEVYDNSHISGENALGAMIVAGPDGFQKAEYRKFNFDEGTKIATTQSHGGNDYAMMKQMLERRLKKVADAIKEGQEEKLPDLLLIDGGVGHKKIVTEVIDNLALSDYLDFICISKGVDRNAGLEEYHTKEESHVIIDNKSPLAYYLQTLRDEAHRFAIAGHRARRGKSVTKSEIDEIPNIGVKRKKILLQHFGSIRNLKSVSEEDIASIEGIGPKIAAQIYGFLHE